jgi:hypothetical protein
MKTGEAISPGMQEGNSRRAPLKRGSLKVFNAA